MGEKRAVQIFIFFNLLETAFFLAMSVISFETDFTLVSADAIFAFALSVILAAIIFARLSSIRVASAILASLPALLLGACQRIAICSQLAGLAVVSFCIVQTFSAFACNSVAISRNARFHISVAVAFLARSPVQRIAEKVGLALFAAIAGRTSWTVEARDVR